LPPSADRAKARGHVSFCDAPTGLSPRRLCERPQQTAPAGAFFGGSILSVRGQSVSACSAAVSDRGHGHWRGSSPSVMWVSVSPLPASISRNIAPITSLTISASPVSSIGRRCGCTRKPCSRTTLVPQRIHEKLQHHWRGAGVFYPRPSRRQHFGWRLC
jgi:hypothetical protein